MAGGIEPSPYSNVYAVCAPPESTVPASVAPDAATLVGSPVTTTGATPAAGPVVLKLITGPEVVPDPLVATSR